MDGLDTAVSCPSDRELESLHTGDLSEVRESQIRGHLAACPSCRGRHTEIVAKHEAFLGDLRRVASQAPPATPTERASPRPLAETAPTRGSSSRQPDKASTAPIAEQSRPSGARIGGYTILRELGRGGFGIVYEAQQDHPRRPVALKVIRAGRFVDDQQVKLFQREAHVLARLRHPYIGAIYEAGRTEEGQHYFAMELVRGRPLMDYVRQAGLSVHARLELFRRICEAIHYAHQKGVMHRDLKPSNILIDADGNPKVLDFGLAKITDTDLAATTVLTELGQIAGTLPYMSPEQARGNSDEIDIRSDVYSLGVILYELLTERLPYDVGQSALHEAVRIICEAQPRRPSTIIRTLRGDLETIALKALEKEPLRRYQSASAIADDIQRYLADQPILARPASAIYQFRKLVARHKAPFAFAAALFVVVTAFGIWMSVLYQQQRRERIRADQLADAAIAATKQAEIASARAIRIKEFLIDTLRSQDPTYSGEKDIRVSQAMRQAVEKLEKGELAEQPELVAEIMYNVALILRNLGKARDALPLFEAALEKRQKLFPGDNSYVAQSLNTAAACQRDLGRPAEALPRLKAALEMDRRLNKADHLSVAHDLNDVGGCLQMLNLPSEALPLFEEALGMYQRLCSGDDLDVAASLNNVGFCLWGLGRPADGLPKCQAALQMYQRIYEDDHPFVAASLNNVGACLLDLGRPAEALSKYQAALEMRRQLYRSEHPDVAGSLNNVGAALYALGRWDDAVKDYASAVTLARKFGLAGKPIAQAAEIGKARALIELGRFDEAEQLLLPAQAEFEANPSAPARQRQRLLQGLARLYEARHAAEPGKGFDKKAAEWRSSLSVFQASTRPSR